MARPVVKKWVPKNKEKYAGDPEGIVLRSNWERRFFHECDNNPNVLHYSSEELIIPYFCETDQRMHRYFPDALMRVKTRSGEIKTFLVEIKPYIETQVPVPPKNPNTKRYQEAVLTYVKNQSKWKAARAWCAARNIEFVIMTEYELGLKKRPSK